jgi:hypothetical protein
VLFVIDIRAMGASSRSELLPGNPENSGSSEACTRDAGAAGEGGT